MPTKQRLRAAGVTIAAVLAVGGIAATAATMPLSGRIGRTSPAFAAPAAATPTGTAAAHGPGTSDPTGRAASRPAGPGTTTTAAPPKADPCTLLAAADSAAAAARATEAERKLGRALAGARADGCPGRGPAKQADVDAGAGALARSLGVSDSRLEQALRAVKRAGTTNPADQAAVFARSLGIDRTRAETVLRRLLAAAHPGPAAMTLATRLGIATDRAQWVLSRVRELGDEPGGDAPTDPDFVALARQVGVSPERLGAAVDAAERATGTAAASPSPTAGTPTVVVTTATG